MYPPTMYNLQGVYLAEVLAALLLVLEARQAERSRKRRNGIPSVVLDEHQKEGSGEAAIMIWKNEFAVLGKES